MNFFKSSTRMTFPKASAFPLLALAAMASLGLWACGTESEDEDEPTVKIESPANGSTVTGPKVLLRVSKTNFTYGGAAAGKVSAAQHEVEGGHIHIFLDKPIGPDATAYDELNQYDTLTLDIPTPGTHYIIVEGANSGHVDVEGMVDSVKFTVNIP